MHNPHRLLLFCFAFLITGLDQETLAEAGFRTIVCALQSLAPGQAETYYQKGLGQEGKNKQNAFESFEKAMRLAREEKKNGIYLKSVLKLASLGKALEKPERDVYRWITEAIGIFDLSDREDLEIADLNYFAALYEWDLMTGTDTVIRHFEAAKRIRIKIQGEWHEEVAKCYNGLGNVYKFTTYDFLEAEKCLEKALEIREHIHLDDDFILAGNYYSLATTNRSQKDFDKAIAYAMKTIEFVRKIDDLRFLDRCYLMVANIYRDMNQMDNAKAYYQKAIDLFPSANEPMEKLATYYTNLGETLHRQGKEGEALVNFRKAYSLIKKFGVEEKMTYVYLLQVMSETLLSKGDDRGFLETSRELANLLSELNLTHSRSMAESLLRMGNYFRKEGQSDSALLYFQRSMTAAVTKFHFASYKDNPTDEQIGMNFYVYEILLAKSQQLEDLYHRTKDREYLVHAYACSALSEKLLAVGKNAIDMEESRWKFLDANFDLYEQAISQLYESSLIQPVDSLFERAFYFFERSKSQALTQAVANAGRQKKRGITDSILLAQQNYKKTQFSLQDHLQTELGKAIPDESQVGRWREQIVALDRKMQQNKVQIEKRFPGYYKMEYEDEAPSIASLQQMTGSEEVVLLEYFWGAKNVYAMGIYGNEVIFKKIGKSDSIHALAAPVLAHLVSGEVSLGKEEFFRFRDNAFQLYRRLIRPFDALTAGHKRLQIVPDGLIAQIPVEVLITEENKSAEADYQHLKYLVRQFDVSYAYSSLLLTHRERTGYETPSLLAMGFTGGNFLRAPAPGLPQLEGSEKELEELARIFTSGKFLKGEEATEAKFKNLAPSYSIIHLAIHGRGDPDKEYSASLFFQPQADSLEDGELHAYELYDLKLAARLAVLGSCESGLGKSYRGEGMISMASAFTYAGCQNVLMSLWKVQDNVAMQLMGDFYKQLMENNRIDRSLSEAKRQYIDHAGVLKADPRIWAPLVAYGNQMPVFEKQRNYSYYYFVAVAFIVLLVYLRGKQRSTGE